MSLPFTEEQQGDFRKRWLRIDYLVAPSELYIVNLQRWRYECYGDSQIFNPVVHWITAGVPRTELLQDPWRFRRAFWSYSIRHWNDQTAEITLAEIIGRLLKENQPQLLRRFIAYYAAQSL